jgi:hypothetical protein
MTNTKMTIAAKKQWVVDQLTNSQRAVELALVAIYNRQTADEQATDRTSNVNSMGFNGLDADFGSKLAKAVMKYGKLTPNQLPHARKMLGKYWKQLIEIAETKRRTTGRGGAPWVEQEVVVALPQVDSSYENAYDGDYGCQWCGCPEFHDGEECPSEKARCLCGNQKSHGYENMCFTCVNAERAVSRAETMGY